MVDNRSPYDALATFYDREWGPSRLDLLALFDRLGLAELPAPRGVLDLCCGTGQMAGALSARGHEVTAVDLSGEMLRFASRNAPRARLIQSDMRTYRSESPFDVVLCAWNGFTELLDPSDLLRTCSNVRASLAKGGIFLFDMTLHQAMQHQWGPPFFVLHHDRACFATPTYCSQTRVGKTAFTVFVKEHDAWQRSDTTLMQRGYRQQEVRRALTTAGFDRIDAYDARRDLGITGGEGRVFFRAE